MKSFLKGTLRYLLPEIGVSWQAMVKKKLKFDLGAALLIFVIGIILIRLSTN